MRATLFVFSSFAFCLLPFAFCLLSVLIRRDVVGHVAAQLVAVRLAVVVVVVRDALVGEREKDVGFEQSGLVEFDDVGERRRKFFACPRGLRRGGARGAQGRGLLCEAVAVCVLGGERVGEALRTPLGARRGVRPPDGVVRRRVLRHVNAQVREVYAVLVGPLAQADPRG